MRLPTIQTLAAVFGDRAHEARELLEKKRKTTDYESVRVWEAQSFNRPRYTERLMCALNEIAGALGVDALFKATDANQPVYEYLNMGDSYAATLVFNREAHTIRVASIGDILERSRMELI